MEQNIEIALENEPKRQTTQTFVVTIKDVAPFVSQVSYEKNEKDLKLFFSLKEPAETVAVIVKDEAHADNTPAKLLEPSPTPAGLLLEKVLFMVTRDEQRKIAMAHLSQRDFDQTHTTSAILPRIVQRVQDIANNEFSFAITFEEHGNKKGLFYSVSPALLKEFKEKYRGAQKGHWVLWSY